MYDILNVPPPPYKDGLGQSLKTSLKSKKLLSQCYLSIHFLVVLRHHAKKVF